MTWFSLLGLLTFVLVTLLGVRDIDFFGYDRLTQLPLVNVRAPTALFFWAAPPLTTAIYAYFHFYLLKLGDVLGADRVDGGAARQGVTEGCGTPRRGIRSIGAGFN